MQTHLETFPKSIIAQRFKKCNTFWKRFQKIFSISFLHYLPSKIKKHKKEGVKPSFLLIKK